MSFHGPVIIVGMGKPPISDEMKEAIESKLCGLLRRKRK